MGANFDAVWHAIPTTKSTKLLAMASPDELSLQAQKKYVPHHSLFRGGTEREKESVGFLVIFSPRNLFKLGMIRATTHGKQ